MLLMKRPFFRFRENGWAAGGETLFETKGKIEFNDKTDSKTGKTDLFFQAG